MKINTVNRIEVQDMTNKQQDLETRQFDSFVKDCLDELKGAKGIDVICFTMEQVNEIIRRAKFSITYYKKDYYYILRRD